MAADRFSVHEGRSAGFHGAAWLPGRTPGTSFAARRASAIAPQLIPSDVTMTFSLHRRSLRTALAACAALLAGACTPPAPSGGPSPAVQGTAETRLASAEWNAQSPAAQIAAWARQGCRR